MAVKTNVENLFNNIRHYGQCVFDKERTAGNDFYRYRHWNYDSGYYETVEKNGRLLSLKYTNWLL